MELAEKRDFIVRNLSDLAEALELPSLAGAAERLAQHDSDLRAEIEAAVAPVDFFATKSWPHILSIAGLYRSTLYGIALAAAPRLAIETGVLHGLSTVFLLQGLKDAGHGGQLVSIDDPSTFEEGPVNRDGYTDTLPPRLGPGWIVGGPLRELWSLRLGSSREQLPAAIGEGTPIDFFVHDSEHTYETMRFEFETAWEALSDGGVLLADNIEANTSFFDFCGRVGRIPHVLPPDPDHMRPGDAGIRVGLIRK